MNKKIYLHIGTHKTGTTSLQKFLTENRKELIKRSFYFPTTGSYHYSQHNLAFSLQNYHPIKTTVLWENLITEIKNSRFKNIIISSEEFSNIKEDKVELIKSFLNGFDIKIIVYLRRQSDLIESIYNQQVKDWRSIRKEPIEYFLKQDKLDVLCEYLNYFQLLNKWSNIFGLDNIIIKIYDKDALLKKSIVLDFLNTINCELDIEDEFNDNFFLNINKSVSVKTLEIIRLFKHLNESKEIGELLYKISNIIFPPGKFSSALLTKEEKIFIDKKFDDSNKKILEKYFKRRSGKLFSTNYKEVDKEILTKLDIMKILVYFIKNYINKTNK